MASLALSDTLKTPLVQSPKWARKWRLCLDAGDSFGVSRMFTTRRCNGYRTTGSVPAIVVDAVEHTGWPHPFALTPGIWPAWGVMS